MVKKFSLSKNDFSVYKTTTAQMNQVFLQRMYQNNVINMNYLWFEINSVMKNIENIYTNTLDELRDWRSDTNNDFDYLEELCRLVDKKVIYYECFHDNKWSYREDQSEGIHDRVIHIFDSVNYLHFYEQVMILDFDCYSRIIA